MYTIMYSLKTILIFKILEKSNFKMSLDSNAVRSCTMSWKCPKHIKRSFFFKFNLNNLQSIQKLVQ